MSDFFKIDTRPGKRGVTEIYPKFIVGKPNDLMIRGSDFYAIWMEERGLWSTDEQDVIRTIDRELRTYADEYQKTHDNGFHVLYINMANRRNLSIGPCAERSTLLFTVMDKLRMC